MKTIDHNLTIYRINLDINNKTLDSLNFHSSSIRDLQKNYDLNHEYLSHNHKIY